MKMQCELLQKKFNNATTTAEGVGFIESMLGGDSAHRVGALKAGLREGLSYGVLLRCPYGDCDMHNNTTPYRSLGSGLKCPRTHSRRSPPYLECAGCGTSRTNPESTSCQNCGKWFR